jgi:hypothetical protein
MIPSNSADVPPTRSPTPVRSCVQDAEGVLDDPELPRVILPADRQVAAEMRASMIL